MAEIKAFGALRYTPQAGEIRELVCPPYDIISEEMRQAFLRRNPRNIIRLELPREGEAPYRAAGDTLAKWIDEGMLSRDPEPGIYIYEERFAAKGRANSIKGIVCLVGLEPFSSGVVLPHEETLSKAKADRFELICATGCNLSSIYSLYMDPAGEVSAEVDRLSGGEPLLEFKGDDEITHLVWRVTDSEAIGRLIRDFADKKLYIADGHHRYETALHYREHLWERGGISGSGHAGNYVMMTLVSMEHSGLGVFPTHRVVRGLAGFSGEKLLEDCKAYFDLLPTPPEQLETVLEKLGGEGRHAFGFYDGQSSVVLTLRDKRIMHDILPESSDAYRSLDVNILHLLILERLLRIDKENMAGQKNLLYTRDPAEALGMIGRGEGNCAFFLNPTKVSEIAGVAGAGEKMPQKSTYFYPKLITGHLMNKIEP